MDTTGPKSFARRREEMDAMKNYTPLDDGSGPKDPYLGVMDKEYTSRRSLFGRWVTNKVLHKMFKMKKTEIVDVRKELKEEYERKKVELEANYAKKIEEFDKMVQDVFEKLISKLPTNVVREFLI
ncbi:hypothetical protein RDABS01_010544 [Bienertia sinuspersici]